MTIAISRQSQIEPSWPPERKTSVSTITYDDSQSVRKVSRRNLAAFGVALGLHLLVLSLFLSVRPKVSVGEGVGLGAMDVSLAGLSRSAAAATPPAPTPAKSAPALAPSPPVTPEPIKPRSVLAIVSDILAIPLVENAVTPQLLAAVSVPQIAEMAPASSGAPGAACDIGGTVQTTLRSDPATHGALLLLPRRARSASDAVMIWNGNWIDPTAPGDLAEFATIRRAIRKIVASAQPECRDQSIVGPRFMLVPETNGMMVVVVGNASWRWTDLLNDPPVSPFEDGQ